MKRIIKEYWKICEKIFLYKSKEKSKQKRTIFSMLQERERNHNKQ